LRESLPLDGERTRIHDRHHGSERFPHLLNLRDIFANSPESVAKRSVIDRNSSDAFRKRGFAHVKVVHCLRRQNHSS